MNTIIKYSLIGLTAVVLSSCSRHSEATGEQRARAYLQPFLHSGESTTNIIARFGYPISQNETRMHELRMDFLFSDTNHVALVAGVGGFTAFFTNNQLSDWLPIYKR
jgi:hypothetical protein